MFDTGEELQCHRLILSHRSTVFRTLLNNEARSSNQGPYGDSRNPLRVRIKEHSLAVFTEIVRYLYCGHVEITSATVIEILKVAKIYQINDLIEMLWPVVVDALDCENVCDILRMAHSSGLPDINEHCMVYFQRHKSRIFNTEAYQRLKAEEPTLGMKVLEEMHSREPIGWYWSNPTMCPKDDDDFVSGGGGVPQHAGTKTSYASSDDEEEDVAHSSVNDGESADDAMASDDEMMMMM